MKWSIQFVKSFFFSLFCLPRPHEASGRWTNPKLICRRRILQEEERLSFFFPLFVGRRDPLWDEGQVIHQRTSHRRPVYIVYGRILFNPFQSMWALASLPDDQLHRFKNEPGAPWTSEAILVPKFRKLLSNISHHDSTLNPHDPEQNLRLHGHSHNLKRISLVLVENYLATFLGHLLTLKQSCSLLVTRDYPQASVKCKCPLVMD